MARRKRYSRTNLIIVLIIACVILIYFLSRNTFSLFESEIEGSSDTDVAFYVFNDSLETHEIFIDDIKPGDTKNINFSVQNYRTESGETQRAEVNLTYTMEIKCTENLPLQIQLAEDTGPYGDGYFDKDSFGTWFYYFEIPARTFNFNSNQKHDYKLKVNFPSNYNDPKYQDIVEAIEITVVSKQVT